MNDKATYLKVAAGVRYWEDATINGVDDADGTLTPLRVGETWCPTIRISDGVVMDWPDGVTADIHFKVCDDGEYWLLDDQGRAVAKWAGCYVPDKWLCPKNTGYGDYIILSIGGAGRIDGWRPPDYDDDRWEEIK